MLTRTIAVWIWLLAFAVLNVQSKLLVEKAPHIDEGIWQLIRYALGSGRLYAIFILYAACACLYLVSLRLMPLTVAGPIFTIAGALTTFLLGMYWFGEDVTTLKMVGLGLCLSGMLLLFLQT